MAQIINLIMDWIIDYFDIVLNCTCEEWCIAEFGYPAPIKGTPFCDYCTRKGYVSPSTPQKTSHWIGDDYEQF